MNIQESLLNRRSIRKYSAEKIDTETINEMLRAAMYAPSAVNKMPWEFIVCDDKNKMEEIMEIHRSSKMLTTASHAIIICGDLNQQHDDGFWLADCGAATQNLLLSAHGFGIGSCWIGIYPREQRMKEMKKIFKLPEHIEVFAVVSLGYPDEEKAFPERFNEDKIHWNTWN